MTRDELIKTLDRKNFRYWMPNYLREKMSEKIPIAQSPPAHIILCFVDHFEPFNGGVDFDRAKFRVDEWTTRYPRMVDQYRDADGKRPQHTWFYPPHLDQRFLKDLLKLCKDGYGEIEMHLHHNHMPPFPDTADSLRQKIKKCIRDYSRHGIFCLPDGSQKFGFIHGDWSLDNSRGEKFCGVNNEITILKECGCYADFTFPSLGQAQPEMVNKIYYAKDDPDEPKSYNRGVEVVKGTKASGDLLIIPGIIGLRWKSRIHRYRPSIEASNLDSIIDHLFPERVDYLVENALKVKDGPNWRFIKIHTHGAKNADYAGFFVQVMQELHVHLKNKYNDGLSYRLHYVTAREMYNLIKAAEAGKAGNPDDYRDFSIPRYVYLPKIRKRNKR